MIDDNPTVKKYSDTLLWQFIHDGVDCIVHVDCSPVDCIHVGYIHVGYIHVDYSHVDYSHVDCIHVGCSHVDHIHVDYSHPAKKKKTTVGLVSSKLRIKYIWYLWLNIYLKLNLILTILHKTFNYYSLNLLIYWIKYFFDLILTKPCCAIERAKIAAKSNAN